jgi:hypothetical protein
LGFGSRRSPDGISHKKKKEERKKEMRKKKKRKKHLEFFLYKAYYAKH